MTSHDEFTKYLLQNTDHARDFLQWSLPSHITAMLDLNSLASQTNSYIDEHLKKTFSDIVYTVALKPDKAKKNQVIISILIEHKSNVVRHPHFQLLRYMLNIWEQQLQNKEKPTPVLPIIFYHGKEPWQVKKFVHSFVQAGKGFSEFIPDFDYILTDLSIYSNEDIKNAALDHALLKGSLLMLKNIFDESALRKNLTDIAKLLTLYHDNERGTDFLRSALIYLCHTTDIETDIIVKEFHTISEEAGEIAMTTAERLRQEGYNRGIQQGIEKGILQGIETGKLQGKQQGISEGQRYGLELSAKNMLRNGDPHPYIMKITGLSLERIKELKQEISEE